MIAIIAPIGTLLLGIALYMIEDKLCWPQIEVFPPLRKFVNRLIGSVSIVLIIAGVFFCLFAAGGGIIYMENKSFIARFKGATTTIKDQREIIRNFHERIAITSKVIDLNAKLAEKKYWKSIPVIGWYLPDELNSLEPIR